MTVSVGGGGIGVFGSKVSGVVTRSRPSDELIAKDAGAGRAEQSVGASNPLLSVRRTVTDDLHVAGRIGRRRDEAGHGTKTGRSPAGTAGGTPRHRREALTACTSTAWRKPRPVEGSTVSVGGGGTGVLGSNVSGNLTGLRMSLFTLQLTGRGAGESIPCRERVEGEEPPHDDRCVHVPASSVTAFAPELQNHAFSLLPAVRDADVRVRG